MEFTKLSEVAVVETANDDDKVLIEQNGEIKRVPKTQVGGAGGNTLFLDLEIDMATAAVTLVTVNMTLEEAMTALANRELSGATAYVNATGVSPSIFDTPFIADYSLELGAPALMLFIMGGQFPVMWTSDGFAFAS